MYNVYPWVGIFKIQFRLSYFCIWICIKSHKNQLPVIKHGARRLYSYISLKRIWCYDDVSYNVYQSRNKCSKIVSVHFNTTRFAELYFKETVVKDNIFLFVQKDDELENFRILVKIRAFSILGKSAKTTSA